MDRATLAIVSTCRNEHQVNTCPYVRKWIKTFLNYGFCIKLIRPTPGIDPVQPDEILPTVSLNGCTDCFKARFTLNPKLSFCTATSIKATTSSCNASAVASMRLSQRASSLFIAVKEHQ